MRSLTRHKLQTTPLLSLLLFTLISACAVVIDESGTAEGQAEFDGSIDGSADDWDAYDGKEGEETNMGASAPPDDYDILSGVWGTDIDRNESVVLSGASSLEFKNTTPAADPRIATDMLQVTPSTTGNNSAYNFYVVLRATRINAGDTVSIVVERYDASRVLISGVTVHSAVLSAVDTWLTLDAVIIPTSTTRYLRVVITKNNVDFTLYVDEIYIARAAPYFNLTGAATTIPGTDTWTTIDLGAGTLRDFTESGGTVTATYSSVIIFNGVVAFASTIPDGTLVGARILVSGTPHGEVVFAIGAAKNVVLNVSAVVQPALVNASLVLQAKQDSGFDEDISTSSTRFAGVQIMSF